jgi:hypothetical protein
MSTPTATNVAQFYKPNPDILTADIDDEATTVTRLVADDGWPGDSSGPGSADYFVQLDDGVNCEIVEVTSGQGDAGLTVTRAAVPYAFAAVNNGRAAGADGAMTEGETTLTCATSKPFLPSDVGKVVSVANAGSGGDTPLVALIDTFTSSSVVVLSAEAAAGASDAAVEIGTPTTLKPWPVSGGLACSFPASES